MYHMGVVRALIENGALPTVISGTSGGSIVAGVLAVHTDEEMVRGNSGVNGGVNGGVQLCAGWHRYHA